MCPEHETTCLLDERTSCKHEVINLDDNIFLYSDRLEQYERYSKVKAKGKIATAALTLTLANQVQARAQAQPSEEVFSVH